MTAVTICSDFGAQENRKVSLPKCLALIFSKGFPGGSEVKASAWNVGDPGSIPGSGRRQWQPTPVLLPGESHGWRNLVGYSPWGCKELAMTEQLSTHKYNRILLSHKKRRK